MKGMLAPKFREVVLGHAEVRQTYKVSGVGTVAGCYVTGRQDRAQACCVRVVRDGIVIHEGASGLPAALQGRRQGGGPGLRVRHRPWRSSTTSRRATSSRPITMEEIAQ